MSLNLLPRRCHRRGFLFFAAALLLVSCGASNPFRDYAPLPSDKRPIPQPAPQRINLMADAVDKLFANQVEQSFDLSRHIRTISRNRKRAFNADPFGEVPNSSWFTNRNGLQRMSLAEIARGPDQGAAPDPTVDWRIISAKVEGVTPGFNVQDAHGNRWVIKFEPKGFPEMNTGAEVVSTKLFHAAGYFVPENYIVVFDPKILKIEREILVTGDDGKKRPLTYEDLGKKFTERVDVQPDGKIRAIASKFVPGLPLGPFHYEGTRKDDPNDFVPHEHRRELRGLRIIAAWLNHFDTKANNSLDVYLSKEKYIRHYLIDFGSTLGSNGDEPMPPYIGSENGFDPHQVFADMVTLGLNVKHWEKVEERIIHPAVGYFVSDNFRSHKYQFITPNPAFELMTDEDAFWGAKIVMSFSDEQIRVAVEQGQYSDPAATDYLTRTIIERRDITGRYWFSRMTPLDRFRIEPGVNGKDSLTFTDLAIEAGLATAGATTYRYEIKRNGKRVAAYSSIGNATSLPLYESLALSNGAGEEEAIVEIAIQAQRGQDDWIRPVWVYLLHQPGTGYQVIGLRRS